MRVQFLQHNLKSSHTARFIYVGYFTIYIYIYIYIYTHTNNCTIIRHMLWHLWEEYNYRWNIYRVAKGVHTGSLEVLPLFIYVVSCHHVFVSSRYWPKNQQLQRWQRCVPSRIGPTNLTYKLLTLHLRNRLCSSQKLKKETNNYGEP